MTAHTHRTLRFLIVGVVVLLLFIGALAFGATNYSLSYLWQGFVDGAHQRSLSHFMSYVYHAMLLPYS